MSNRGEIKFAIGRWLLTLLNALWRFALMVVGLAALYAGAAFISGFILAGRAFAADLPTNANIYRIQLRTEAQRIWGPSAPVATLAAQIEQESGWRPTVTAWDGGRGLAQFMPRTQAWACKEFADALGAEPCDAYRPRVAFRLQAAYMQHLYDRVDTANDDCDRMGFALMGFNSGEGWRIKRQARSPAPGNVWVTARINPGVTPANQKVAQDYPVRVLQRLEPRYVAAGWGDGVCS